MQGLWAMLGELPLDLGSHAGGHGRAQVQVRQGRAQVEARSPHQNRASLVRQKLVDLCVGEGREPPRAELAGHVDEADEAMLEPLPLLTRRGAAQGLDTTVDLD